MDIIFKILFKYNYYYYSNFIKMASCMDFVGEMDIVTGCHDGSVKIIRPNGHIIKFGRHAFAVSAIMCLSNWQILSASVNGELILWDFKLRSSRRMHLISCVNIRCMLKISTDEVLLGCDNGNIILFHLTCETVTKTFNCYDKNEEDDEDNDVQINALISLSDQTFAAGNSLGIVFVYDIHSSIPIATFDIGENRLAFDGVTSLSRLSDSHLMICYSDGTIIRWNSKTSQIQLSIKGDRDNIWNMCVLDDGRIVTIGYDNILILDDPKSGKKEEISLPVSIDFTYISMKLSNGNIVLCSGDSIFIPELNTYQQRWDRRRYLAFIYIHENSDKSLLGNIPYLSIFSRIFSNRDLMMCIAQYI